MRQSRSSAMTYDCSDCMKFNGKKIILLSGSTSTDSDSPFPICF